MKNKKGFTLVELLAVIVILAVILVIAVPKITSTINSTRKGAFESSIKMIAQGAEREKTTREMLGNTTDVTCDDVANLSATDYILTSTGACAISFDANGVATVTLNGASGGKFKDCTGSGTKASATVTGGNCATS